MSRQYSIRTPTRLHKTYLDFWNRQSPGAQLRMDQAFGDFIKLFCDDPKVVTNNPKHLLVPPSHATTIAITIPPLRFFVQADHNNGYVWLNNIAYLP